MQNSVLFLLLFIAQICTAQIVEVEGSIRLLNSQITNPQAGMIIWNGTELKAYDGYEWISLFSTSGKYYYGDMDGDNYGNIMNPVWVPSHVNPPIHFVTDNTDCLDSGEGSEIMFPGASFPNGSLDENCEIQCVGGYVDCNGQLNDGCEIDTLNNRDNCGGCGQVCPVDFICVSGVCQPPPDGTPCDDGNGCSMDDKYLGGVCLGSPRDCDDGDPCTDDTCVADGQGGYSCIHTPIPNCPN